MPEDNVDKSQALHKNRDVYQRLFGQLRPFTKQAMIGYTAVIFVTGLNLIIPQIIADAIDNRLAAGKVSAV